LRASKLGGMNHTAYTQRLERLLYQYLQHLDQVAGLAVATRRRYAALVRDFLYAQRRRLRYRLDWRRLKSTAVIDYLVQRQVDQAGRLHCLTTALRSFFAYLVFSRRILPAAVPARPSIATGGRGGAMDYLEPAELQQLLGTFDQRTKLGRRDYALATCLARLGLRAGEVARLQLADLDWRQGRLHLRRTKGRRARVLPLPPAVGSAVAKYLQRARPATGGRHVFASATGAPLSGGAISAVIRQAVRQMGLVKRPAGAHLLRHTLATHLVQRGVPLKAIADVLGHRDLNTTLRYAQVHRPRLLEVAQPWPQEVA
jgi:integrase/recombinase XerD